MAATTIKTEDQPPNSVPVQGGEPNKRVVLNLDGLSVRLPKRADRKYAVEDVSFTVNRGEMVCIVGESGSGKSVTAKTIMGLIPKKILPPTAGKIELLGEDLLKKTNTELRALRNVQMAMIFQEPMTALNPVMTVGRQISEVLEIHTDMSKTQRTERVIEIMGNVNLPDPELMLSSYPHQLSGGQRQRIMIAMALILEPALIIADEPTTALDVTTQAQILTLLKKIQKEQGTGVMFVTHDFGVVAEIADQVVVMQSGRVVEQGPMTEVLHKPRHAYTKMLIQSVPNLVPPERDPVLKSPVAIKAVTLHKTYASQKGLFGGKRIVHAAKDINFSIKQGETLGVVGESGSGKSTTARLILRLVDLTKGEIWINGVNIAKLTTGAFRPFRKDIQIIFQDPYRSLNPRRTVGQSIIEGPVNFGLSKKAALARAQELMEVVGISPTALDRFPHQFSGGQRQRICIARAIAMEPKLLIADEPVSALDVSVQAQVLDLLEDVRKRFDLALLFITHDLRVAAKICDRVLVMKDGELVEAGSTHGVYTSPKHPYTRALLAAAPGRDTKFASRM